MWWIVGGVVYVVGAWSYAMLTVIVRLFAQKGGCDPGRRVWGTLFLTAMWPLAIFVVFVSLPIELWREGSKKED